MTRKESTAIVVLAVLALLLPLPAFSKEPIDGTPSVLTGSMPKDREPVSTFYKLLRKKEAHQRERNVAAYMDMLPPFLVATLKNQAVTMGYDDEQLAASLKRQALSETVVQQMQVLGLREEGQTAALLVRWHDEEGKPIVRLQTFYLVEDVWKVGETREFYKDDLQTIQDVLSKVTFMGALPEPPPVIKDPGIEAMFDILSLPQGWKLEWSLNGVPQPPLEARLMDSSASGAVMGGVKKGMNTIEAVLTRIDAVGDPEVSITIRPPAKSLEEIQRTMPHINYKIRMEGKNTGEFSVEGKNK